jgi:hypothetical protein
MSPILACKLPSKKSQFWLSQDLGEVIEHLRRNHQPSNIKRPQALGVSTSHGHLWYCFGCGGRYGKDHKSFDSDRDMWEHISKCHDHWLEDIIVEYE